MLIFEASDNWGENTIIISEDLSATLEKIGEGFEYNLQVTIWENGECIFCSKTYKDEDFNIDNLYIELMSFVNGRG